MDSHKYVICGELLYINIHLHQRSFLLNFICIRVQDCLPLYDILNEFQKGQSHMAAVVHRKDKPEDAAETATSEREMVSVTIKSNSTKNGAVERGNCLFYGK